MPRTYTGVVAVAVATLALSQQACSATDPDTSAAAPAVTASETATTASPTVTTADPTARSDDDAPATPRHRSSSSKASRDTAGSADRILQGRRQVVIKPVQSSESVLALADDNRLTTTDGAAGRSLFVLTPNGRSYLIKTATAGRGGEPSCLGVRSNGSDPLTVEAAACDAGRAEQLFTIRAQGRRDAAGRPVYSISNRGAFLRLAGRSGLIAEELGDSPLTTTFTFVDNGPATLPQLGD